MTHFYLTLPSNSSQQFFPENTMTEFTTKLSSTIELANEWEVGLAEIMFPRSWYTIPHDGLEIDVDCGNCIDTQLYRIKEQKSLRCMTNIKMNIIRIKGGHYNSMEKLTQELNEAGI